MKELFAFNYFNLVFAVNFSFHAFLHVCICANEIHIVGPLRSSVLPFVRFSIPFNY